MNNPFRNLVKKPAKHEKGEIVVADSGNVKEVAKIMIGFEALLRETQSYMSKACGNKLFDSDLKDAMRQLIKQYMKDHNYYCQELKYPTVRMNFLKCFLRSAPVFSLQNQHFHLLPHPW